MAGSLTHSGEVCLGLPLLRQGRGMTSRYLTGWAMGGIAAGALLRDVISGAGIVVALGFAILGLILVISALRGRP